MSELQVVEPTEVLVPLDRSAAEKLDGRIRRLAKQAGDQLVQVGRLLDEAKAGRIHEALGHSSWTAYVADAVGGQLQLSSESRQAMVQLMAGEGMSVRAIAAATGVSKSTVSNDLSEVSNDGTPEQDSVCSGVQELDTSTKVTGLDGKTYTKPKRKPRPKNESTPKPEPEPVSTRKAQIPTAFRAEAKMLGLTVGLMGSLAADPRWVKAASRFTDEDRTALDSSIMTLQAIRAAMDYTTTTDQPEEKTA